MNLSVEHPPQTSTWNTEEWNADAALSACVRASVSCPTTRKFLTLGVVKARGQGMQLSTAPAQHEHLTRVLRRLVELYEEARGGMMVA